MLRTYDTAKYFVVLMVPLLPLGKLKILDECPKCSHHRVAKLKVWEREGAKAVEESLTAFESAPDSRDAAVRALGTRPSVFFGATISTSWPSRCWKPSRTTRRSTCWWPTGTSGSDSTRPPRRPTTRRVALPDSDDARHNLILYLCRKGDPDAALELLPPLGPAPSDPPGDDAPAAAKALELDRDVAGQTLAVAEALGVARPARTRAGPCWMSGLRVVPRSPAIRRAAGCGRGWRRPAKKGKAVKPVFPGGQLKTKRRQGAWPATRRRRP